MPSDKDAERLKEVQKKAIKEYGEKIGFIFMVGYMEGRVDGIRNAMKTFEEHDKGTIFVPKDAEEPIKIRKIKV